MKMKKQTPEKGKKKGKVKKVILIIVIIFAALIVLGAIVSGTGDSDKGSTSTKSTTKSTTKQAKEEKMTTAQKNAYQSAQDYLATAAFSRQGLIDQLTSDSGDGYDKEDAEFAVKKLEKEGKVSWKEQAVKAAKSYLDTSSFSKSGLIEQLESEYGDQFTHEQAVYGADKAYK